MDTPVIYVVNKFHSPLGEKYGECEFTDLHEFNRGERCSKVVQNLNAFDYFGDNIIPAIISILFLISP